MRWGEWVSIRQETPSIPTSHSLCRPPVVPKLSAGAVGVGVMDYHGSNDDRQQADQIHASYVEKMMNFVLWLVDNGRPVRLFTTDVHDEPAMQEVIDDSVHAGPNSSRRGSSPSQCPLSTN